MKGDKPNMDTDSARIPLEFEVPDSLVSRYATNFIAQHTPNEFVLSFYEVCPPLLLGDVDENRHRLEELGHITASCVARLIVSPSGMRDLVEVLTTSLQRFEQNSRGAE